MPGFSPHRGHPRKWMRRQLILPLLVAGVAAAPFDIHIVAPALIGLAAIAGVVSLVWLTIMMSFVQLAQRWSTTSPTPSRRTHLYAEALGQIITDSGWSSLIAMLASVSCLITASVGVFAVVAALFVSYGVILSVSTIMLILQVTNERITGAVTGADLN